MRLIALLLLLINLAVLAWLLLGEPGGAQRATGSEMPDDLGELALLDEAPMSDPAPTADDPPTDPDRPDAADSADDTDETVASVTAQTCYTIGPFVDTAAADEAALALAAEDIETETRVIRDEETYGYQVYLPPFDSRDAALAATRELADAGIHDYFVVAGETDMEHAVSLGVFSERQYADNHRETLRARGFDPELRVRTREQSRYWHDYEDPQEVVTDGLLADLAGGQPVQRLARECD